jgi:hypothetical protein
MLFGKPVSTFPDHALKQRPMMKSPIRELPRTDLPRPLVYATGVAAGVVAAMVVQILMARTGVELSGIWRNLLTAQALQLRSAGAWWLMEGAAFLTSAVIVAALSRLPWPWHRLRGLRWLLGIALVFALAEVGHIASGLESHDVGAHLAVTLIALAAAAFIALFGAYFAVKR